MKRAILCGALAAALLAGCAGDPLSSPPAVQNEAPSVVRSAAPAVHRVRVAYIPDDPLNPYLAESQVNRDLCPLLYDSLVALDPSFRPQPCLAQSVVSSGAQWTVRLREDVYFSNGQPLTAADVAYSLGVCIEKDAGGRYANVASYGAADARTLLVTLARPDVYFEKLLTFPVIPDGSGAQATPPGTGRYIVSGERLTRNDARFGDKSAVGVIELVRVESAQEIGYRLMSGQLDVALLEPDTSPMETAGSFPVQTNDMVYLAFNTAVPPLDSPAFRRAIGLLVDRSSLVHDAFGGRAAAAAAPVNPMLFPADPEPPDAQGAGELLDALGLDERSDAGWRMRDGAEIELQLCYNVESANKREAAALIKSQIEAGGVRVALNEYAFDDYCAQVAAGGYSLYLGQARLPEDMALDAFLSQEGSLHFDLGDTSALYEEYRRARGEEGEYAAFLGRFAAEAPLVPLLFDQAVVAHARNFYSTVVATERDIFYNIHKW